MTDQEKLAKIQEMVIRVFDPETNGGEYWETGNFDDTFQMGVDVGENQMAEAIGQILGLDFPDINEIEV